MVMEATMKRTEKAAEILRLKKECNSAKDALIYIERRIRELSNSEADKLGKIIGRLEHWQNT